MSRDRPFLCRVSFRVEVIGRVEASTQEEAERMIREICRRDGLSAECFASSPEKWTLEAIQSVGSPRPPAPEMGGLPVDYEELD